MTTKNEVPGSKEETSTFEIDPDIKRFYNITKEGVTLPLFTSMFLEDIKDFEVRPSDIFILSYPKTGTTLTQYMVTQIIHGQLDKNLLDVNFFLEAPRVGGFTDPDEYSPETEGEYKRADEARDNPRLLKSHLSRKYLPKQLFTKKPKVILLARNPKDTAVSFYHFTRMVPGFPNFVSWSEFYEYFCRGFVPDGDWFSYTLPYWEMRNEPNVMFLKYEDIVKDLRGTVEKLSEFLEKPITPDQLEEITRNVSFDAMKKNKNVNYDLMPQMGFISPPPRRDEVERPKFMRKGKVGDWRNFFTLAQNDRFDALYRSKMADTDLEFDFGE